MSLVFAILGLGALIVVHELGHMWVARLCGMRVEKFSVGFGPTLLQWRGRPTVYRLALVPLGGYVKVAGMDPHDELPEGDTGSYANKPTWAKLVTILAGPLTNYLFAMVLLTALFMVWGVPNVQEVVGGVAEVSSGSPAARAGLRAGDRIVEVGGQAFATNLEAVAAIQRAGDKPLVLAVERGGRPLQLTVKAEKSGQSYRIGVIFEQRREYQRLSAWQALALGVVAPFEVSAQALGGLGQMLTGQVGVDQMGGPLEIVRQLKVSVEHGLARALELLGMLNVFLGLFNLLPVPGLDGGRLVFLTYTLVTRRPVNQRVESTIHYVGIIILLGLIVLLTFNDLPRWFAE